MWHAYHRNTERVTLLYSASFFRNSDLRTQVGRANRLHHWLDMLRYKNAGIATYDFGGWYELARGTIGSMVGSGDLNWLHFL